MLLQINALYDKYHASNQTTGSPEPQHNAAVKPAYAPVNMSKVQGALAYLDPDGDEAEWKLKRLAPMARQARDYPDQAEALYNMAKAWSRGDYWGQPSTAWVTPGKNNGKTGEEIYDQEWQRFIHSQYAGNETTLGTLFHDAKGAGWIDEEDAFTRQEMTTTASNERTALAPLPLFQPLEPSSFPHYRSVQNGMIILRNTIENTQRLLQGYEITASFDVIKKDLDFTIPGQSGTPEGYRNAALTIVISLANLNGINTQHIPSYIELIANQNPINRVANWINSRPWDGIDRLPLLLKTLQTPESYPSELKEVLLRRWSISAVAAAMLPSGFHSRLVLTLQGPQSLGKSFWFKALINDSMLSDDVILTSHHLDVSNKDTVITAVTHWITELGELDSTFKKDHARLKGFITNDTDKVRRPYGRGDSVYPRRTVFCASVNDNNFLIDPTGNTRFGTIEVQAVNYQHDIDMQQYFAQMAIAFGQGQQWWLTHDEERQLEQENSKHAAVSVIGEKVLHVMNSDLPTEQWTNMSASAILEYAGIRNPTNTQARECGHTLRQCYGEPKKIKGIMKWRVPINPNSGSFN